MAKSMTKAKVADYLAGKLELPKKTVTMFLEELAQLAY
ncbi:MAG: HU family DNA-binding protein, partial [Bacillati bacterium ANGP1]